MIHLELERWKRLFNVYAYKEWQTSYKDKRYGNVFYTVENDTYLTLDVANEVYVEEFNNIREMREFYGEDATEQMTIFEVI
ncbi:hypothetical protein ETI08_01150 [Macrococcoides goetzii]|nr:hypothetical protein [Macrococcus goetzii]TDM41813.1 hypothetical protein ETI10_01625 [Macrococcus goetzii]TDM47770.1 hypothetical protein ETI08_01150 [Macrococcus goetzii]